MDTNRACMITALYIRRPGCLAFILVVTSACQRVRVVIMKTA